MARNGLTHIEPYLWNGRYMVYLGELLHRLVWEQHNGTIPPGYILHHINGDKTDNKFENLKLMTRAEHNSLHRMRLGYRAPIKEYCEECGKRKSQRDIINNSSRRLCWKCRVKKYKEPRNESDLPV